MVEAVLAATAGLSPRWRRPISVDEYHRMIDAGVFADDARLELLAGAIVTMSPHGQPHARAIEFLNEFLVRSLPADLLVRCQLPLTLVDSEPEPDLAVVIRAKARRAPRHPTTALLVIEVAAESLDKDRAKVAIYAAAGVTDYWIVNLDERVVEVHGDPNRRQGSYRTRELVRAGALPSERLGVAVPIAPIFGGRR